MIVSPLALKITISNLKIVKHASFPARPAHQQLLVSHVFWELIIILALLLAC